MTHRLEEPLFTTPPAVEASLATTVAPIEPLLGILCLEVEGIEIMLALTEDWGADGE